MYVWHSIWKLGNENKQNNVHEISGHRPADAENGDRPQGVPIPVPPDKVLSEGNTPFPSTSSSHGGGGVPNGGKSLLFLVLFFDAKRTWQWLPGNKLEELGGDDGRDDVIINSIRKAGARKNIREAYARAMQHKEKVKEEAVTSSDSEEDEEWSSGESAANEDCDVTKEWKW